MAVCKGLNLSTQLGYFFSCGGVQFGEVSWITTNAFVHLDFAYLLAKVLTLSSSPSICISQICREATFTTYFMVNQACSHLNNFWVIKMFQIA